MPHMGWGRIRRAIFGEPAAAPEPAAELIGQQQMALIAGMAQRIVDVVNESMRMAHHSKNIETRRSRAQVAREKIGEVQAMAAQYPFLRVEQLADVERDLAKI